MIHNVIEKTSSAQTERKKDSVLDWVNYLIYADLPSCSNKLLEDINPIIHDSGKTKDIEGRLARNDSQSINAYHELVVGKSLLRLAQSCDYQLEYERQSPLNCNKTPDWTISSNSEIVLIEVATKHISNLSLIKQAFIGLIADRNKNASINYTHFALPYFDKEKPDYYDLQNHYNDLIIRIGNGIDTLSTISNNTICVDGLKITLGSSPSSSSIVGSTPSRYLLSIAEKAEKYKQLSQVYPLIIAIVSKNFTRGGALSPKMMTELLYGTLNEYHHEQFNICECDHHKLTVMQPSINKIAGILFCDMHNYNRGASSYEYYPNPHRETTGNIYNKLQIFYKGSRGKTQ